jgi:hypothetical protein
MPTVARALYLRPPFVDDFSSSGIPSIHVPVLYRKSTFLPPANVSFLCWRGGWSLRRQHPWRHRRGIVLHLPVVLLVPQVPVPTRNDCRFI